MLLNSKLPIDVLGRVWELADIDKDGMLDNDEFAVVRMNITPKTVQILPVTLLDRARFFQLRTVHLIELSSAQTSAVHNRMG